MYILDTDLLSLLGRADSPAAQRLRFRLAPLKLEERITTIITYEEQIRGWMAHIAKARSLAKQVEAYAQLSEFLLRYRKLTVLRLTPLLLPSLNAYKSNASASARWI